MKSKKTRRRNVVKGALANAIQEATRPSYSQVQEAKALARKMMGIPDLYSNNFLDKQHRQLIKIARLINEAGKFIHFYSMARPSNMIVGVHKKWLDRINSQIEASNDYRTHNQAFFLGIPKLKTLEIDSIRKTIKTLVVVLQCKQCSKYLLPSSRMECCENCLEVLVQERATEMAKEVVAKAMFSKDTRYLTKNEYQAVIDSKTIASEYKLALNKARKLEEASQTSSSPSFYSKDHLKSSTPSRIEKGMNENIHTYYAKPKRLEVSHR
tara:strand:+ start:93 stop:896 length:804 start_codon:yes stop_codon:yes gene_type:complete